MRFKGLDLNLLQVLQILLERRSVTRAAEQLHISQPAISAALSRLRQHFDDPLLVQHGKQMIPSPFALRLQPGLKTMLGDLDALISTPARFDPATSAYRFRIMASDFILVVVFGDILAQIEAAAPGVRLVILPPTDQAIPMLEVGEIDLIITPSNYLSDRHPAVAFFEERHVVAGWAENPVMARATTVEDLTREHFISVQMGRTISTSFAIHELSQSGIVIDSALTTTTFAAVPQLLIGSASLAILHESFARKAAHYLPIRYWPLPVEIAPMREMIQYHRARTDDPSIVWLVRQFTAWAADTLAGGARNARVGPVA